jgi:hypothetical protein
MTQKQIDELVEHFKIIESDFYPVLALLSELLKAQQQTNDILEYRLSELREAVGMI